MGARLLMICIFSRKMGSYLFSVMVDKCDILRNLSTSRSTFNSPRDVEGGDGGPGGVFLGGRKRASPYTILRSASISAWDRIEFSTATRAPSTDVWLVNEGFRDRLKREISLAYSVPNLGSPKINIFEGLHKFETMYYLPATAINLA